MESGAGGGGGEIEKVNPCFLHILLRSDTFMSGGREGVGPPVTAGVEGEPNTNSFVILSTVSGEEPDQQKEDSRRERSERGKGG